MEAAKLSIWESHHFWCSRACCSVEFASRSRSCGALVPGQHAAPAGTLKSSRLFLPCCRKKTFCSFCTAHKISAARLRQHSYGYRGGSCPPQFYNFPAHLQGFRLCKERVQSSVFDVHQRARETPLDDPDHVENLRTTVCQGRFVDDTGSLGCREEPFFRIVSQFLPVVEGQLAKVFYLVDGFYCRALRTADSDFSID